MSNPLDAVYCGPDALGADARVVDRQLIATPAPTSVDPQVQMLRDVEFKKVAAFVESVLTLSTPDLVELVRQRFSTLRAETKKARYAEFLAEIERRLPTDKRAARLSVAAQLAVYAVPIQGTTTGEGTVEIVKWSLDDAVNRTASIVRKANSEDSGRETAKEILKTCLGFEVRDINHISYILATAHHESLMGKSLEERGPKENGDKFAADAYFFDENPYLVVKGVRTLIKKNSYNGYLGNKLAGDQINELRAAKVLPGDPLADEERKKWNGKKYPTGSEVGGSELLKTQARRCDFYQYRGRGLVHLTGRGLYRAFSNKPYLDNVDFEERPEQAEVLRLAARILVRGMVDGLFRPGEQLTLRGCDIPPIFDAFSARNIVNGDKRTVREGQMIGWRIHKLAQAYKSALVITAELDDSLALLEGTTKNLPAFESPFLPT